MHINQREDRGRHQRGLLRNILDYQNHIPWTSAGPIQFVRGLFKEDLYPEGGGGAYNRTETRPIMGNVKIMSEKARHWTYRCYVGRANLSLTAPLRAYIMLES